VWTNAGVDARVDAVGRMLGVLPNLTLAPVRATARRGEIADRRKRGDRGARRSSMICSFKWIDSLRRRDSRAGLSCRPHAA
jgi:hypothetical protein